MKKKQFKQIESKSFAFWCVNDNPKDKTIIILHFNLWIEHLEADNIPLLDVGFRIDKELPDFVNFYLPFKIELDEISDLGNVLSDANILSAIFNENYSFQREQACKYFHVKDSNNKDIFHVCELDVKNDINIRDTYGGSIIKIDINELKLKIDTPMYIRFRISSKKLFELAQEIKNKDFLFESAISLNKFIDFRFNDIRTLDTTLLQEMNKKNAEMEFEKIHFLLMTKADVDIINSNSAERLLEDNVWYKYMGFNPKTFIVANHWRFEGKKEFNLFIKLKLKRFSWFHLLAYLFIIIFISVIANVISPQ